MSGAPVRLMKMFSRTWQIVGRMCTLEPWDYLFIELPENMLYRDMYHYQDIKWPISG